MSSPSSIAQMAVVAMVAGAIGAAAALVLADFSSSSPALLEPALHISTPESTPGSTPARAELDAPATGTTRPELELRATDAELLNRIATLEQRVRTLESARVAVAAPTPSPGADTPELREVLSELLEERESAEAEEAEVLDQAEWEADLKRNMRADMLMAQDDLGVQLSDAELDLLVDVMARSQWRMLELHEQFRAETLDVDAYRSEIQIIERWRRDEIGASLGNDVASKLFGD